MVEATASGYAKTFLSHDVTIVAILTTAGFKSFPLNLIFRYTLSFHHPSAGYFNRILSLICRHELVIRPT